MRGSICACNFSYLGFRTINLTKRCCDLFIKILKFDVLYLSTSGLDFTINSLRSLLSR